MRIPGIVSRWTQLGRSRVSYRNFVNIYFQDSMAQVVPVDAVAVVVAPVAAAPVAATAVVVSQPVPAAAAAAPVAAAVAAAPVAAGGAVDYSVDPNQTKKVRTYTVL